MYKGDNRLTIWLHHGIWLPESVEKIDFYTYPDVMAHLIGIDDWAKTNLELPKSELKQILMNQEYQYVTSIDTSASGQVRTYNMSGYRQIPDSILNSKLPLTLELKSSRGDFLIFNAKSKDEKTAFVNLYTDWN